LRNSWRDNFGRLTAEVAASPLPTRQLKRMAGRAVARELLKHQKVQARKDARRAKNQD